MLVKIGTDSFDSKDIPITFLEVFEDEKYKLGAGVTFDDRTSTESKSD